jgi:C4-dicarboxylate transporter DctM subunit
MSAMPAWLFVVIPVGLLLFGFPIYLILLITALVALQFAVAVEPTVIPTTIFGSLDSFPIIAIPFFVLAGEIMGQGGIAKRIITWVLSIVGGIRGSLAITTVASSEIFGAMSGSSLGTVAAVGRLLLPALRSNGYSERFSTSLISASGAIAVIIPPSLPLIIYGVVAQQPVTVLFLAGIVPAILIGTIDTIYVLAYARMKNVPRTTGPNLRTILKATKDAGWALGTIVLLFGGIYGGIFTPTEAAGMAVVYSFLVSKFIYRDITWKKLWEITMTAAQLNGQILVILTAAACYSWFLTTSGIPQQVIAAIQTYHLGQAGTLLLFNAILIGIGSFLEPAPAILILTPLFLPVVVALGVSPIHFGIIMAVNISLGLYTPPFGINLFGSHSLFGVKLGMLYRGVVPFMIINAIGLLIITYVPQVSLTLPSFLH